MSYQPALPDNTDPGGSSKRATKEKLFFGLPIAIGLGWLLLTNIATIVAILSNTLTAVLLLAAIAGISYVLLDGKFRSMIWFVYRAIMRKIVGTLIDIDPVSVVKTYIADMKANRERMYQQIANLKGQVKRLEDVIADNQSHMSQHLAAAKKAKTDGQTKVAFLKVRRAGKLEESTMRIGDLKRKMDDLYNVLVRMYEVSGIVIEDAEEDVNMRIRERDAMISGHSAFKSALKIIRGNPEQAAIFEQAMDAMADDIAQKKGEMEMFMDMSDGFMKGIDIDNQIFEDKGFALLEKYQKGESLLLGYEKEKALLLEDSTTGTTVKRYIK